MTWFVQAGEGMIEEGISWQSTQQEQGRSCWSPLVTRAAQGERRFRAGTVERLFPQRVAEHWNRLPTALTLSKGKGTSE